MILKWYHEHYLWDFFLHIALANSVLKVEWNIMKDLKSSPTVVAQNRMAGAMGSKRFSTGLFPDINKEDPTTNAVTI